MRKTALWTAAAMLALAGGLFAYDRAFRTSDRPDCPGTIICPITGGEICKDQCPLIDSSRPDCPGRIVCPLTGELVCRDRCPLGAGAAKPKRAAEGVTKPLTTPQAGCGH